MAANTNFRLGIGIWNLFHHAGCINPSAARNPTNHLEHDPMSEKDDPTPHANQSPSRNPTTRSSSSGSSTWPARSRLTRPQRRWTAHLTPDLSCLFFNYDDTGEIGWTLSTSLSVSIGEVIQLVCLVFYVGKSRAGDMKIQGLGMCSHALSWLPSSRPDRNKGAVRSKTDFL